MSNSVQLKHVIKQGSTHSFYGTQVTLGIVSVIMCASIGKSSLREKTSSLTARRSLILVYLICSSFLVSLIVRMFFSFFSDVLRESIVTSRRDHHYAFPSRILGLIQLFLFLFTRLDLLVPSTTSLANITRYDQILLLLPAALTILLFLFDMSFFIIMFRF